MNWLLALKPICSATTRNPYNGLLGFVSVAGVLGFENVFKKKGNISQEDIAAGSSKITEVGMYYVAGTANDGKLVNDWGTAVIFKPVAGRYTLLRFGYNCGKIGYAMHNGSTWGGLIEL